MAMFWFLSQSLHFNSLVGDQLVTMPLSVVLPIFNHDKERLKDCSEICLFYRGKPVALLKNPEFYAHRKEERCARQFGTTSPKHPYIKVHIIKCNFKFKNLILVISFVPDDHKQWRVVGGRRARGIREDTME